MIKLHTKFEVSMSTYYEGMKGNAKCRIWVVWERVRGYARSPADQQCHHSI